MYQVKPHKDITLHYCVITKYYDPGYARDRDGFTTKQVKDPRGYDICLDCYLATGRITSVSTSRGPAFCPVCRLGLCATHANYYPLSIDSIEYVMVCRTCWIENMNQPVYESTCGGP